MLPKYFFLFFTFFCVTFISNCGGKNSTNPDTFTAPSDTASYNNEDYLLFTSAELREEKELTEIKNFMAFYPDLEYSAEYDRELSD